MNIRALLKQIRGNNLESPGGINYRAHWVILLCLFVIGNIGVAAGAKYVYTSIDEGTFFVEAHIQEVAAETLSKDTIARVLENIDIQGDRFDAAKVGDDIPRNPFVLGE